MAKPKKWDSMTPDDQEAWLAKNREKRREHYKVNRDKVLEACRKWREANPEKARETARKWQKSNPKKQREHERKARHKTKQQTAADQFFILAGAAEQLTKLKPKQ